MPRGDFVAYYRVSTTQKPSEPGLDAQREMVEAYLNGGQRKIVAEFVETEVGRNPARPKLEEALAAAGQLKVPLIVARLSRLTRSVAFLRVLRDSGVKIVFAEIPDAHDLTVQVLASVAEWEAKVSNSHRRDALVAPKARLQKLSGTRPGQLDPSLDQETGTAARIARSRRIAPAIAEVRAAGEMSPGDLARRLTEKGILTPMGHSVWSHRQVTRLLAMIDK